MKKRSAVSEQLIKSENYRSFLKKYFEEMGQRRKINYSDLSRRCGFASRSYIKEVLDKRKSLTAHSVGKIKKGLKLSGLLGNFFELLVSIEEPEANVGGFSNEVLRERIEKLRLRLKKNATVAEFLTSKEVRNSIFLIRHVSEVYASLGSVEMGASLDEIRSRCGLSVSQIEPILLHFLRLGVIEISGSRYYVKNPDIDIYDLDENINFQKAYLQSLASLVERAEKGLKSPQELFLHTAFSVQEIRLPILKKKLQQTIEDFMNEEQDDLGEKVVKMNLGFYL